MDEGGGRGGGGRKRGEGLGGKVRRSLWKGKGGRDMEGKGGEGKIRICMYKLSTFYIRLTIFPQQSTKKFKLPIFIR